MSPAHLNPAYSASQAWVRARLSRLLTGEDWLRLLESRNSAEMVRLLRGTWAEPAVAGDSRVILRVLIAESASAACILARFIPQKPRELFAWYNRRYEIQNLKIVLRSIHYRADRDRAMASLIPLAHGDWKWETLFESGSAPALLDRLRDSPYGRPLEQGLERYSQEKRLFYLEIAIDLFYFQRLVKLIDAQTGADKADARADLGKWIQVQNLIWAYRYRIYGQMRPEEILNFTLHRAFSAGLEVVRRIALGSPLIEEAARLGFRLPAGHSNAESLTELEVLAERERYRAAAATLHRPMFSLAGALAYLSLLECEIRDLGVIAEGKSAGLTSEEIRPRLLRTIPASGGGGPR